jgi:hypothetical protein
MFNILANLWVCLWIFLEHLRVMGVVVWIYSFLAKADCGYGCKQAPRRTLQQPPKNLHNLQVLASTCFGYRINLLGFAGTC